MVNQIHKLDPLVPMKPTRYQLLPSLLALSVEKHAVFKLPTGSGKSNAINIMILVLDEILNKYLPDHLKNQGNLPPDVKV